MRLTQRKRPQRKGRVVASIKLMSSRAPYFYVVHLWDDRKKMLRALSIKDKGTQAMTFSYWNLPNEETPEPHPSECLGEIHFAMGSWSIEVVTHEVFHAVLHRGRMLPPHLGWMISVGQDMEEHLAYEQGEWTQALMGWLAETDPETGKAMPNTMNRKPGQILKKLTEEELEQINDESELMLDMDDERN